MGLFKLLNIFLPFIKLNNKKIVFCSYYGGNYSCNPKYITEELIKQNVDCELIWLVDKRKFHDTSDFPLNVRIVDYLSLQAFFELARSKIWIDNCRKMIYPIKNKNQYYIQTWHGNIGFKKIEKDIEDKLSGHYIKSAKNDSLMIDFCISNSTFMTQIYKNSFWYSGKVLEFGSPRNDFLINSTDMGIIKRKLHLQEDTKIILYAPTFRNDTLFDIYNLDYASIISALNHKDKGKWIFLVKLHPNLILNAKQMKLPDEIINVTLYPDIQELLGITDILISDYSSVMFDFMFTRRPVFIYAADYGSYRDERGLHFSLNESPFLIAENNEQLINNIISFNLKKYNKLINLFIRRMGCFENGNSSRLVVDKIQELLNIVG
jgi:CDP-glycerol glycerophosphotransferase